MEGVIAIPLKDYEPTKKRTKCTHVGCELNCWSEYIKTANGLVFIGEQKCGIHSAKHAEAQRKAGQAYEARSNRNDKMYEYLGNDGLVHHVKRAQYYRAHREGKVAKSN